MKLVTVFFLATIMMLNPVLASDDHAHNEVKGQVDKAADKHADHKDEDGHKEGEHEEEGHEEANSQVGPNKGIAEADKEKGFKLSPEAEKNFELQKIKVDSVQFEIPTSAVVTSGVEINLYRLRDGFYTRIDFTEIKKNGSHVIVKSDDVRPGDEVVVKGMGFLRMTEITAFDGAPAGHSH